MDLRVDDPHWPALASELPPVAGAQPQAHEVATLLRLGEILVGRAAVHDAAIVQDLDLARFYPEVMSMRRIGQEIVQQFDRCKSRLVEYKTGLLVAASDDAHVETDPEATRLGGEDRIPVAGVGRLGFLLVAIEGLIEPLQQVRVIAQEIIVGGVSTR